MSTGDFMLISTGDFVSTTGEIMLTFFRSNGHCYINGRFFVINGRFFVINGHCYVNSQLATGNGQRA